jgi:hypothetical protein
MAAAELLLGIRHPLPIHTLDSARWASKRRVSKSRMVPNRRKLVGASALMALIAAAWLPRSYAASRSSLPWNMRETAMTADGRLTMLGKPWWPRAQALGEGQSFTLDLNHDGRLDTMIVRRDGNIIEAVDDSGHASQIWNQVSTTYVVSYHGTGVVDRMVSYIDNNGDGRADEVDIRYYRDGYLRYALTGECYDGCDASKIFDLKNWQYSGYGFASRFRGNTLIFFNKYDPQTKSWVPASECPFSFWDLAKDGRSEVVLRVSAAPLASLKGPDPDYANNYKYLWARNAPPLSKIGAVNMRLSFNIDPWPRTDPLTKPHYNFGFTSVGAQPYRYSDMVDYNSRRRPPQKMIHINWKQRWVPGVNYPANQTGFTWDEARSAWRWEGQFWIYERVYLSNTGAPTHRWNMRREYSSEPSSKRRIYYSQADRRYHLLGAQEGWLEVGHLVDDRKDLEFRWFDQNGDGYLNTVEVYRPGRLLPVRVSHFDPQAHPVALSLDTMRRDYNRQILPQAIAGDQSFLKALERVASDPLAQKYKALAVKSKALERKRYCLDIARELDFLKARDTILASIARLPYPNGHVDQAKSESMKPGSSTSGYSLGDSVRFWNLTLLLHKFENQYADGQLNQAAATLGEIIKSQPEMSGPGV